MKCKGLLFSFLILALVLSCQKDRGKKDRNGRGQKEEGGPPVRVETIVSRNLPQRVEMVSVLAGRKQAEVYSRVAGKISYIGAAEGQRVREGEVLFRIDRSDPGESFLATPVVSPISGWVGRWLISNIGAQVTAQQPVVTVVDDAALVAKVQLPTTQWLQVSEKTPVRVKVGEGERAAKVTGIARAAESTSSRGTITVEIDNQDHLWKAGMVSLVTFDLDLRPRIILPSSSLSITDEGSFVFLVRDNLVHRTRVKFSVIDNDTVEVMEGPRTGDVVITEGIGQVADGLPVKVVEGQEGKEKP